VTCCRVSPWAGALAAHEFLTAIAKRYTLKETFTHALRSDRALSFVVLLRRAKWVLSPCAQPIPCLGFATLSVRHHARRIAVGLRIRWVRRPKRRHEPLTQAGWHICCV